MLIGINGGYFPAICWLCFFSIPIVVKGINGDYFPAICCVSLTIEIWIVVHNNVYGEVTAPTSYLPLEWNRATIYCSRAIRSTLVEYIWTKINR